MGRITTRCSIRFAAAVAVSLLVFSLARAPVAQAETPSEFISALGDNAISMLVDDALSEDERTRQFRILMVERFDVPLISRYVLGVHWRRASAKQKDEYATLFEEFIVGTYSSRLGNYGGQTLSVKSARKAGKDIVVSTEIRGPGAPPIKVDWRVRGKEDDYKVIDIIIAGASMVITQRDEFSSVIRRSGGKLDGLLARLRQSTDPEAHQQVSQANERYSP